MAAGYVDWLEKVGRDGGELSWIIRRKKFHEKKHQKARGDLLDIVLNSDNVKGAIDIVARESERSHDEVFAEAKEILDNMAHDFSLHSTRVVGYPVLKVIKRLFDKIYVNMDALTTLRETCRNDSVVFVPTHRTYTDFLLISLICFEANITLPAICAGSDFQSSRIVGEALRKCGAFFIRRQFGNDGLYWAIFSEYVQAHIIGNERPVEFFPEGQRSRVSKSLDPKLGLLKVVTEPFVRNQVYDTILVPVTMNYDRFLESVLYGRELLGSPKPKEDMSGVLKVRSILNQNFGNIFVTFGTPISLRNTMAVNRAEMSFMPSKHFVYTLAMKKAVYNLAHNIVKEHNKNNILTVWKLMAPIIRSEIDRNGHANLGTVFIQVNQLIELCAKFGIRVNQQGSVEDDVNYYLALYSDIIENENGKICLKPLSAEKSKELSISVLQKAIPALILSNATNLVTFSLFNAALTLLICNSNNKIKTEELFYRFKKLRYIFHKEFVSTPDTDTQDFETTFDKLIHLKILAVDGDYIRIINYDTAQLLMGTLQPYIHAYKNIMERITKNANITLEECRKQLAPFSQRCSEYLQLSGAVIHNVLSLKNKNSAEISNFKSEVETLLSPVPDQLRSRL
ncbi:unnamed protein product [Bursaphelenchus xylophilus]|uniref:(pine wood nematode) hypothetical protein n=1 Tax=Bursaphelenchus xylophilus TaxID=6326 RepID=A0A1I7SUJ1_BURXY|nr:unnamed protein product [Bursaphelenchus xylophilus]CAG9107070.1 unnamed protein product [Bursaphelenchus xylophilus]